MWKIFLIFLAVVSVCYCQTNNYNVSLHKRKPYYHDPYFHLIYGGGLFYYLTFLVVKVKAVVVIGSIIVFLIFAGKFFALIKYFEYSSPKHDHHKVEKIYIQAPDHHGYSHGPPVSYSAPVKSFSSYGSSFPSGITLDHPPPNAEVTGGGGGPSGGGGGPYYDSPPPNAYGGYGRNYRNNSTYEIYYDLFKKIINKLNLTEAAFGKMQLESSECKRKFVCSADYHSKYISILSTALTFLSDDNYDKYKTNEVVTSLEDCSRLYPTCKNFNLL